MPTSTWHNLTTGKRDRITGVAMREFGARGFSAGSLNVIAREAGIAKGSLFQYFEDKRDLYAHVCELTSRDVRDEFSRTMERHAEHHHDLFDFLRAVLLDWVAYFRRHPEQLGILFAATFETDRDVRAAVRAVTNRHFAEVLTPLVVAAEGSGQIRPDAPHGHLLATLMLVIPHLALAPFSPELDPVLEMARLEGPELAAAITGWVDLLEAGVAVPRGERRPADLVEALAAAHVTV